MPTVEVSRLVRATRAEVERALSPGRIVEYEGAFAVGDVTETERGRVVEARPAGRLLAVRIVFERRDDGYVYRHGNGDGIGPLVEMETTLAIEPENGGVRVTLRSTVRPTLPVPLAGRLAAWRRRRELERALSRLAADVERPDRVP